MVTLTRLFVAAIALSASSAASTLQPNNATLTQRAPDQALCGVDRLSVGLPRADEALLASNAQAAAAGQIQVIWRVIHKDNTYQGGYLSQDQIHAAINELNRHYASSGFSFVLAGGSYVKNPNWFDNVDLTNNGESQASVEMKTSLHTGTAQHLNIYSTGLNTSGFLGYARFPWWYAGNPKLDGVVFKWTTTPNGAQAGFNTGKILVHEVGHWLGLLHTFEGGCAGEGDGVLDTPAEASPASGCPINRDTCPGFGADPIHNHMVS
ncbi:unnamed protein product [Rhizoctonia solani]|uniref:Peptidase M43 pregnancy-associated plasma-A domain-containing protein n=1 Tax=Rhizoctonia solani TaxID=456999 RepID=A0A8H2WZY6_9AGAM|nr:unnamed protein product [Rhizoctonia solani]